MNLNLPSQFGKIPRHALSYSWPSPIHLLPKLTETAHSQGQDGSRVALWVKREDQAGPLACYGNKYRKFEYIIPDILAQKQKHGRAPTMLVTEGGTQSNHTVQVASIARVLDLKCIVLLHKGIGGLRKAGDKEAFIKVGNVQLNRLLGADVRLTDERDTGDEKGPLIPLLDELRAQGEVPYWISSGASLHPLGGLGYARCAFEIEFQEQQMVREAQFVTGTNRFDYIFVACGSGSTLAGLIAGFKLLEKLKPDADQPPRKIIGVLVSRKSRSSQEDRILRLSRMAGQLVGLDAETDITPDDIHLDDRFVGHAYGILDSDTAATVELAASTDALVLDPVYTAKVMRGMMCWARDRTASGATSRNALGKGLTNALFIHTGGQSALNAYADVWPSST
ncbi:hypothetical protein H2198_002722 [Neophaeococcomyces mojaviensis]|uniref:Uncharacterized protein n=1 Tax=Neophaeococcomyces mojaviensis TaxID=3383035 RepID=A0ACC3ADL6_9EURO|nr:hypothetical protein H2198_002722 [Knufia sp. JES_112]